MTLSEYQDRAMETCLPASDNFAYMRLNLVGEVGEFAGKVGKYIRKGKVRIDEQDFVFSGDCTVEEADDYTQALSHEAGDILWQLAGLCTAMGWSLEIVARQNLDKLADRKKRGVIASSGDNR